MSVTWGIVFVYQGLSDSSDVIMSGHRTSIAKLRGSNADRVLELDEYAKRRENKQ